ncbi:DoxX family protein [Corynebacterium sp.]|uniref:DoxX family protein n=1 Tax=Corynebacterium sp. TaxID=1720 RepID=UPI0026DC5522|nr:DoxX family protein [Corynebacterium sp.]MDO5032846.1 DoxX family protein [Corynebacterium sp.]
MSDKNVPDKATEFDDDFDVPTYDPSRATPAEEVKADTAAGPAADEKSDVAAEDVAAKKAEAKAGETAPVADAETSAEAETEPESQPAATSDAPKRSSLFERAGRAEPQVIKPRAPREEAAAAAPAVEEKATTELAADASETAAAETSEAAETEVFASPAAADAAEARTERLSFDSAAAQQDAASAEPETTAFPREEAPAAATASVAATAGATAAVAGGEPEQQAAPAESPEEEAARLRAEEEAAAEREGYRTYGRRGTMDFGLFFVRLALGAYLLIAGASTFFKLGGNEGLSGLEAQFADYSMASVLAIGVPTLQLIAGAFLLFGLVTPLAAMFGLVVTGFSALDALYTSHAGLNVFAWSEAVWLGLVLFVIAVALQFTGPGFVSLDFKRSWARRPLATSWVFVLLGIAALVAIWWFGAGVNPVA